MNRRAFIGTVAGAFLAAPLASEAQPAGRVPKIGYVSPGSPSFGAYASQRAFLEGLRDHGYVPGHDFILEVRSTEGRSERLFDATTELVRAPVDVLLIGVCGAPLDAARRATQTIPIVVAACNDDLVETGIVASLGRPGGNITGLSKLTPELAAKRLQLLKQTFPTISRVAVLWNPAYSDFKADWRELRAAAHALGITLHPVRGEFALTPESVCETDRDNAASTHIGEEQRTRAVRKTRRRVAPAWCRQGSGARGARCSNPRMRPTYASGRSRSRRICGPDIRGGPCRSAVR